MGRYDILNRLKFQDNISYHNIHLIVLFHLTFFVVACKIFFGLSIYSPICKFHCKSLIIYRFKQATS